MTNEKHFWEHNLDHSCPNGFRTRRIYALLCLGTSFAGFLGIWRASLVLMASRPSTRTNLKSKGTRIENHGDSTSGLAKPKVRRDCKPTESYLRRTRTWRLAWHWSSYTTRLLLCVGTVFQTATPITWQWRSSSIPAVSPKTPRRRLWVSWRPN